LHQLVGGLGGAWYTPAMVSTARSGPFEVTRLVDALKDCSCHMMSAFVDATGSLGFELVRALPV
jgi:hypothetical protein